MSRLTESPAWRALEAHQREVAPLHMRELFASDPGRASRFSVECGDLFLDYSRHRITAQTLELLVALAQESDVEGWIRRMFAGDALNQTEQRPALHVALRAAGEVFPDAKRNVMPELRVERGRMYRFAAELRAGRVPGSGGAGEPIRSVVNLGIGGSDLGPRMLVRALRDFRDRHVEVRFAANVDPADLDAALEGLEPASTLFIIASKSFTTIETLTNARRARAWLAATLGDAPELSAHFAAVTADAAKARAWGIADGRIFPMWDWVGGRYSLWSSVGLPACIAIGPDHFDALLAGARRMDEHLRTAPLSANMPVMLALLSVWYSSFFGAQSHVLLPYSENLRDFPAWVQQLHMESNGKRVDRDGQPVDYPTAPVIWGAAGTNSQHSFHQLLHQGTHLVPADFIVPLAGNGPGDKQEDAAHRLLVANALAQGSALMTGSAATAGQPHRELPGNRPSSTLLMQRLDPASLGQLLALYEHKVVVEAALLNINPFDQWGVEFGKTVAQAVARGNAAESLDPSTRALLQRTKAAPES